MSYKLLAYNYQGQPAIAGHGAGMIPRHSLIIARNPTLPSGAKLYEIADGELLNTYFDVTSISNYYYEALNKIPGKDYLFIRDRIIKLIEAKAEPLIEDTTNDPEIVKANPKLYYLIGNAPQKDFQGKQGAIAFWDDNKYNFLGKDELGYTQCSITEKEIAARLNIGNIKDHEADFDSIETKLWREIYHSTASNTRRSRMVAAEILIRQELAPYQTKVIAELTSKVIDNTYCFDYHKNYLSFGILGTREDYHPIQNPYPGVGIIDYFYARAIFATSGLIAQDWQPTQMSLPELCDRLYAILAEGYTLSNIFSKNN